MNDKERLCRTAIDLGALHSVWNGAEDARHVVTYQGADFWYRSCSRILYTTAGQFVNQSLLEEGMRVAVQVARVQGYDLRPDYWRVFGSQAK